MCACVYVRWLAAITRQASRPRESYISEPISSTETEEISWRLLSDMVVLGSGGCPFVDLQVLPAYSACAHCLRCCQETWYDQLKDVIELYLFACKMTAD